MVWFELNLSEFSDPSDYKPRKTKIKQPIMDSDLNHVYTCTLSRTIKKRNT